MAFDSARAVHQGASWGTVAALVAVDGSAAHPVPRALADPRAPLRDVADAIHGLCMLHGRHPGAIDHAVASNSDETADAWLVESAEAFATERGYLAQLTAAVGPLPSTPGQAESETAIVAQAHALDMLAQSGRAGCAIGASVALILDWRSIRRVLDGAALRFGVMPPPLTLPLDADTVSLVAALAESPAIERAMAFGAQQVLAQHRGLWDLLDARRSARDDQ
ncbi:hypothetical protein EAH79_06010 [Sphingomonas koreensis]|nr:hypothetical protein EAH79_06010 [Sphingomonas koreensis]